MMKKNYLLAVALALTAMVSCTDESFVGDQGLKEANEGVGAISFNLNVPAVTRADKTGSAAATDLSNQFIVYGEKTETSDGATAAAGKLVFQNYKVVWTANSAYTTTSNTENWEYVGQQWTSDEQSHITISTTDAQTIKYWDWGASSYTFTAVSAKPTDISSGYVTITKTTKATTGNKVYDKGYTVALTTNANLDKLFFSERNVISSTNNTDRTQDNKYGGNVTFRFHNMASKVRVAMYENIPGYSVTINSFKVVDNASPTFATMTTKETGCFKANFVNNASGTAGSMTVKYVATEGATQNHPTVSFTPTSTAANILQLGDQLKANVTIGESATGATYDKVEKAYTSVFPKEENTQNLKLKVCYTLTAPVTGETIIVTDATAEIPAEYLKWKPGYAYTYIFKISDNTNGYTGETSDPAGLYPITFDAVEAIADDGSAEYITTVSEPSITTFGAIYYTDSETPANSKYTAYQTGKNEYQAQTGSNRLDIYATFTEGSTVQTPVLGSYGAQHVNVFKVATPNATTFPITEASVAEAIANPASITSGVNLYTCTVTYPEVTTATVDGTTYYKTDGTHTPGTAGYVPTPAEAGTDYTVGETPLSGTLYTCDVTGVTEVTDATTLEAGTTYYKKDESNNAPSDTGYKPTLAVEGTDYKLAPKITATSINDDSSTNFTAAPAVVNDVPAEDGTTKSINALKLTGVKAGTYAIEYEASAAWTGTYNKVYKVIVVQ